MSQARAPPRTTPRQRYTRAQANLQYSQVLHDIAPLTAELAELEASHAAGAARLQECQEELDILNAKKGELQGALARRTEEAAELKARARFTQSSPRALRYACSQHGLDARVASQRRASSFGVRRFQCRGRLCRWA